MEGGVECGVSPCVLHGVRILIVDDMRAVSEGFERLLRPAGAVTQVAATFDEACRALADYTFDIVLLDLNLNGQSGVPIADAARGLPSPPTVVVVTGDPKYLDVERLEGLGTRVIMKINLGRELVGMVRSVIDELRAGTLPPRSGMKTRAKENMRKTRGIAPLTTKERSFLERLEGGEVLSIETVAREVLKRGPDNVGNEAAVRKFVSRLREKLDQRFVELGEAHPRVEGSYGEGYRAGKIGNRQKRYG
jgi:DNA-binding response OmpR family regulator